MPTEIKIDPSTLPQDGQFVRWQTTQQDGSHFWIEGVYHQGKNWFTSGFKSVKDKRFYSNDVVHWEALSILHLNVHKQAFEVMVTGEKTVEFRKPSDWIKSRLFNKDGSQKLYDLIKITHSYGSDKPSFIAPYLGVTEAKTSTIRAYSNTLVVAVEKGDFIICFGDIIKKENVK